jgi:hypothetical protein
VSFNWYIRRKSIREVKHLLPPINKLPTVRGGRDFIADDIRENVLLLDIGASDRNLHDFLKSRTGKAVSYKSMDVDRSLPHDYYSLDEIKERFDVIVCLEVLEHLSTEEAFDLLTKTYSFLNEEGMLYLTTPNVFHPTVFWRDSTHRSGFRYSELAGLLAAIGFRELEIYRVGRIKTLNRIRAVLANPVLRLLQMDYYSRILIKACKRDGKLYAG